jgi:hypothetical protein
MTGGFVLCGSSRLPRMLTYLILGMTCPFAAAVPPGSFQTYAI